MIIQIHKLIQTIKLVRAQSFLGEDGVTLSNNSIQPEWRSNYKGDYKGNVKPISTSDLLAWSFQVARGMEYLASRKVCNRHPKPCDI